MKSLKLLAVLLSALTAFLSCQKNPDDFTSNMSIGTLVKSTSGNCQPITINGTFQVGNDLNNNSYIDIQLNVGTQGTFDITTDTINGYSFGRTGAVGKGLHTIRLYAKGQPLSAGTDIFTVKYGTSDCSFNVVVSNGGLTSAAIYSLGVTSGTCTGFALTGSYVPGTALTVANTVTLTVNVAVPGSFSVNTTSINGITFSATGQFSSTGPQNVMLTGSGTPAVGGTFPVAVNGSLNTCSFPLTFIAPAAYTLGGAGSTCTGFVLAGNYAAGIILSAANTAIIDVNVTATGGYNISSTTVNGIKFSAAGSFTVTGPQTITLTGSGTSAAAGTFSFPVTGGSSTCSFSLTVNPTPAGAYTMDCAGITVNGTYFVGTALGTSNAVVVPVNVTGTGTYSLTVASVNGISFSKTGVFTTTGSQSVTIPGTGTPATAGTFSYTITGVAGTCPVSITASAGIPGVYSCKVDGLYTDFTDRAVADIDDMGTPYLYLNGYIGPPNGNTVPHFQIFINKNDGSPVGTGTYNENGFLLPNGYRIEIDYTVVNPDLSVTIWNTSSNLLPPAHPPFTITITSVTATRVIGTFSGKLTNTLQGSTMQKTITEGVFNLPIQ